MKVTTFNKIMHMDIGYTITNAMGYRVKKMVMDTIHGSEKEQFETQRCYANVVLACNPESIIVIKVNAI